MPRPSKPRWRALRIVANLIELTAGLFIVASLGAITGVIDGSGFVVPGYLHNTGHGNTSTDIFLLIVTLISYALIALLMVGAAELIRLLVALEENTRSIAESMRPSIPPPWMPPPPINSSPSAPPPVPSPPPSQPLAT